MKRIILATLGLAMAALPCQAKESDAAGIEFSGNIDVVTGYQRDDGAAIGDATGLLRDFRGATAPNRDTFNFYIDQVELDIQKTLGDKIRFRVDLDFGRALSGSQRVTESLGANFMIEQAYVTVGVLGGELALGHFNAPVGYYLADRADNPTISFPNLFNFVTPVNVTGAKMYWAFNDNVDLSVYLVNQLYDCLGIGSGCLVGPNGDSAIPSWGMRIGYNWGEEGRKSTIGLSYLGGPEQAGHNAHLDHILDLDLAWKPTDKLLVAGEFLYNQRNKLPGVEGPNAKFIGGLAVLSYTLSDAWDVFGSYGYIHDFQGFFSGADQQIHNFVLGGAYRIADGAKMKLEYRADLHLYAATPGTQATLSTPAANGDDLSLSHGIAAEFAYNF